ncbi:TetR/AcrR family transcriptional regulator [Salinispira pacifica]|uniref:HTH tetR-type domain-containing protein n=1 Tax=Salinispira pacifica TaxID=1307761 RepID=V5WJW3_9SPIO|nr:TetR/AcrR family transcriptional regulator [Salinispira pacifica]AHC15466.1 hypothetical protein L21SP2_2099 [Salinispira pacifica]
MGETGAAGDGGTKDRILNSSLSLFADKGYAAVSVSEICSSCGITKPSLYYHFQGKEGLFRSAGEYALELFTNAYGGAFIYSGDIISGIQGLFTAFHRFSGDFPEAHRLLFALLFSDPHSHERRLGGASAGELRKAIETFFQAAAAGHGNLNNKLSVLPMNFLGTVWAFTRLSSPDAGEQQLQLAAKTFLHGVFS